MTERLQSAGVWKPGRVYDIPLYIAIGMLAFSGLSFYFTRIAFGLPVYVPEIFLLPLAIAKWKVVRRQVRLIMVALLHDLKLILLLLIWILLVGLGFAFTGELSDVLASARPILYILLVTYIVAKSPSLNAMVLFWVTFGALVGESIQIIFFKELYVVTDNRFVVGINLIAIFLCISLSIIYRKTFLQFLSIGVAVFLITGSGFRIVPAVALLSFAGSHLVMMLRGGRGKLVRLVVGLVMAFVASWFVWDVARQHVIRDFVRFRVVNRSLSLLSGDIYDSQDEYRVRKMKWIWTGVGEKLLPQGFVSKAQGQIGNHNDVPILYFYDTIGMTFSLIFLPWLLLRGVRFMFRELKRPTFSADTVAGIAFVLFLMLLFFNGRFLYIIYEAWLFALILGRWFRTRRPVAGNKDQMPIYTRSACL